MTYHQSLKLEPSPGRRTRLETRLVASSLPHITRLLAEKWLSPIAAPNDQRPNGEAGQSITNVLLIQSLALF